MFDSIREKTTYIQNIICGPSASLSTACLDIIEQYVWSVELKFRRLCSSTLANLAHKANIR